MYAPTMCGWIPLGRLDPTGPRYKPPIYSAEGMKPICTLGGDLELQKATPGRNPQRAVHDVLAGRVVADLESEYATRFSLVQWIRRANDMGGREAALMAEGSGPPDAPLPSAARRG